MIFSRPLSALLFVLIQLQHQPEVDNGEGKHGNRNLKLDNGDNLHNIDVARLHWVLDETEKRPNQKQNTYDQYEGIKPTRSGLGHGYHRAFLAGYRFIDSCLRGLGGVGWIHAVNLVCDVYGDNVHGSHGQGNGT